MTLVDKSPCACSLESDFKKIFSYFQVFYKIDSTNRSGFCLQLFEIHEIFVHRYVLLQKTLS